MQSMLTKLKGLRDELILTQKELAEAIGIPYRTYRNIEEGRNTTYTTAKLILSTVNQIRIETGREPVGLEDLGLNIV